MRLSFRDTDAVLEFELAGDLGGLVGWESHGEEIFAEDVAPDGGRVIADVDYDVIYRDGDEVINYGTHAIEVELLFPETQ